MRKEVEALRRRLNEHFEATREDFGLWLEDATGHADAEEACHTEESCREEEEEEEEEATHLDAKEENEDVSSLMEIQRKTSDRGSSAHRSRARARSRARSQGQSTWSAATARGWRRHPPAGNNHRPWRREPRDELVARCGGGAIWARMTGEYGLTDKGRANVRASFATMPRRERERVLESLLRTVSFILMNIAEGVRLATTDRGEPDSEKGDETGLVQGQMTPSKIRKLEQASKKVDVTELMGTAGERLARSLLLALEHMGADEARRCAQGILVQMQQ